MPERGDKFPIEIDVPLPQGKRPSQYLLADLVLDQSFFIPAASIEEARKIRSPVASAIQQFAQQTFGQRRFTLRMMDGGVRVWRVE
jgi:hypothetical protein